MIDTSSPTIIWFRQDLRLFDNPALFAAAQNGPIIPVFIYDPQAMDRDYGAAQKWWLHHALKGLKHDFQSKNIQFLIKKGDTATILKDLIEKTGAKSVYWARSYEKWSIERDKTIKSDLKNNNIDAESFHSHVIFEPWTIKNKSGDNFKVFTPFFKKCLEYEGDIAPPCPVPDMHPYDGVCDSLSVDDLHFIPSIRWDEKMESHWDISEQGAWTRMKDFFDHGLPHYKDGRNIPSMDYTSRLSPYLRFGMISPRAVWHETNAYAAAHDISERDRYHFLSEVGWREFSFHLLYHYPDMRWKPLQAKFDHFPWQNDPAILEKWQTGQTGYPMIDAGMRQLWQTGWMHNRVRMIVGSLLVKHLLHSWVEGEQWFWDTLVDACPANNTAGWQWIGGCGADAAPYFRIFNPITQGEKFEAHDYVRQYIPEIAHLDDKYLFSPWEAPVPPKDYPAPIIDHKVGREQALAAFEAIKGQ